MKNNQKSNKAKLENLQKHINTSKIASAACLGGAAILTTIDMPIAAPAVGATYLTIGGGVFAINWMINDIIKANIKKQISNSEVPTGKVGKDEAEVQNNQSLQPQVTANLIDSSNAINKYIPAGIESTTGGSNLREDYTNVGEEKLKKEIQAEYQEKLNEYAKKFSDNTLGASAYQQQK